QAYRRNSFDLRTFSVSREGDELVFKVELGKPLWRPPETRRTEAQRFELDNGLFVQHVDIYIDHTPGDGVTESLPGRNVQLDPKSAWDVAVVLTPRPFYLQSLLREWGPSERVLVPKVRGFKNIAEARVPIASLGKAPDPSWGFAVMVSGAVWENTFDAFDRLTGGSIQNALTMPVVTVAEPLALGGGGLGRFHPFVVDVLVPKGMRQESLLAAYDDRTRRLASLPAVYVDPEARLRAESAAGAPLPGVEARNGRPPGQTARVEQVKDELVVLEKIEDVNVFSIGDVIEASDVVARVVVTAIHPKFILATVVEGGERIRPGALVRFSRSPSP
ncbi:MAG: glucodextranase DOMON-like domain-containing protein, partial [Myxococcota bacterium]